MKKCPYCAEEIQDEAIVCRYCGRDLQTPTSPMQTKTLAAPPQKPTAKGIIIFVVVMAVIVLLSIFSQGRKQDTKAEPTGTPQQRAWYACTMFIQKQMGLPIEKAERYNPDGVRTLTDSLYEVTVRYGDNATAFRCDLTRHANGDWQLTGIKAR